jgi:hypothetical protein
MDLPAEFVGRVVKTRLTGLPSNLRRISEIAEEWGGSEVDVIYEDLKPIIVVVFENTMDCLAFKLKYGGKYV